MDLFEEIVKMRRAGQRGALATIVHTNGSIPSYESSRMLVREDGSLVGTVGGGCVEADVWAAAKEVMQKESPRKMVFNLNNEASYIGMIGSKRKVLSVYKALEREGYRPEEFERIYAPMGLEIGALSPEEIAISIVAELIAVRRNAQNAAHKKVRIEARQVVNAG